MNWSLVPPQMVGFLLFLVLAALALIPGGLGIFWLLYQINKSRTADLNEQIRQVARNENGSLERQIADLKSEQGAQHREMMTRLDEMEKRLPTKDAVSNHNERIGKLESKWSDQHAQIEALFERVRKIEIRCAGHGADDTETIPVCGGRG